MTAKELIELAAWESAYRELEIDCQIEVEELNKEIAILREALKELLADTQHAKHHCGDSARYCCVQQAREALEKTK